MTEQIPEATSLAAPVDQGSYFARHWRGELSLPRSYWINGVLIFGLGINIFCMVALTVTVVVFSTVPAIVYIVGPALVALNVAAYVWALVGVWRSAFRYQGSAIWKYLAFIASVLGVLLSISNVAQTLNAVLMVS